jgi:hypothetical protein
MATQVLTQGRDDGVQIGVSATEKVGFFGASPVVQQAATALTTTSSTVVTSVAVAVNEVIAALAALGLTA